MKCNVLDFIPEGEQIQTGKTVKFDGKTRNGFAIFQSKDEPEEVEVL